MKQIAKETFEKGEKPKELAQRQCVEFKKKKKKKLGPKRRLFSNLTIVIEFLHIL